MTQALGRADQSGEQAPKRVLHIGNIANNAYLNAKILRSRGYECDVLCHDYEHIMGCPEWEDAEFDSSSIVEMDHPDWSKVQLNGFQRPDWFIQGPARNCLTTVLRHYKRNDGGRFLLQQALRAAMNPLRWAASSFPARVCRRMGRIVSRCLLPRRSPHSSPEFTMADAIAALFARRFPDRLDKLSASEVAPYLTLANLWRDALACYDYVVGYGTEGCWPMLVGHHPYIAYEHGTIRDIPFHEDTRGRLCAMTYKMADVSFITNADNERAARILGLNYRFIPHPINEWMPEEAQWMRLRNELRHTLNSDFIVFHPSRHHWTDPPDLSMEKGNDVFIRGLARFIRECNPRAAGVFVQWGQLLNESRRLLNELGIADRIHWIVPQTHRGMVRYIKACDLVADQFYLGAFGSTMPKALLHERPAMLYLDEDRHRWCFDEMPPVINTRTPQDVSAGLYRVYMDSAYRSQLLMNERRWYTKHHSNDVIAQRFADVFKEQDAKADIRR
jgi:glycosyltransferase involved in cell wall biosynthesis